MTHPNWIPIEKFDKKTELGVQHIFLTYEEFVPPRLPYFSLDAGSWEDWGEFYNGDVTIEPTHYLDPAVYRNED